MLTVSSVEVSLVGRVGGTLTFAKLDTSTGGSNATLRGPILDAMAAVGLSPATPGEVTDDDLAAIEDGGDTTAFLNWVEWYTTWNLYMLPIWFDQTKGNTSQSLSQMRDALKMRIDFLRDLLAAPDVLTQDMRPGPAAHGRIRAGTCADPAFYGYPYNCSRSYPWRGSWLR